MKVFAGFCAAVLSVMHVGAAAEPLTSVWQLEPTGAGGKMSVSFGKNFFEQRFVPARLAQIAIDAEWAPGKFIPQNSYLFKVFQADGQTAYCTFKDQSVGNVAKSLFLPILDRRPCFIDADLDGRFDSVFTVFDKYGSAITPSGNISSAKPLRSSIAYQKAKSSASPMTYFLRMHLEGSRVPEKTRVGGWFSLNEGQGTPMLFKLDRTGRRIRVMNIEVMIDAISGDTADIDVTMAPDLLLLGDSGGAFYAASERQLPRSWSQ